MKTPRYERFVIYAILSVFALVMVLPFYYMVVTSLKSSKENAQPNVSLVVHDPTIKPYTDLLFENNQNTGTPAPADEKTQGPGLVLRSCGNSVIIALFSTLGAMLLCPLAGYAFAKHRFPGRDALFLVLLATMMIPGTVLLVPSFLLFRDFGWLDTWYPLIVPGLAGAFGVFLARQFIDKIPDSLVESATLDGSTEVRTFLAIIMPLSKPLLATLGIMTFLGSWNSFVGPLIILLDEKKYTLPLVVAMLQGRFPGKENMMMAGAMVSVLPVLVLFFIFQRQIVESLANSGLKEG